MVTTAKNWDGSTIYWDGRGWSSQKPATINKPTAPTSSPSHYSAQSGGSSGNSSGSGLASSDPGEVRRTLTGMSTHRSLNLPGSEGSTFDASGVNTGRTATSGIAARQSVIASSNAAPRPAAYRAPEPAPAPAPQPLPTVTPQPAAPVPIAAPTIRNPYADMVNPYGEQYKQNLILETRGAKLREMAAARENIRRSFAERGLSQAGMSGLEGNATMQFENEQAALLAGLDPAAERQRTEAAANWEQARAAGDLQGMQAVANNYRDMQLLPRQLTQYDIANQKGEIMMPLEARAQEIANQSGEIANQYATDTYDTRVAAAKAELDHATTGNEAARIELDTLRKTQPGRVEALLAEAKAAAQQGALAEWEAKHAGELGLLKFTGNLILTLAGSATKLLGYGSGTKAADEPSKTITMPASAGYGA